MRIGIQISSDLKKETGVENYIYQTIKYLSMLNESKKHQFFLYTPQKINIEPPVNFNIKALKWPLRIGWTQIRLSWELLKNKPDLLFVPAHTFPIIHPKQIIVAIQGLEYERVPKYYSFWQKKKLRFLTKRNAKKAEKIIVPSECTKKDLIELYKVGPKKVFVIPHGIEKKRQDGKKIEDAKETKESYILYLGSGHKRKNVDGLEKAFNILKEKYKIPHQLILAGVKKHINEKEKEELLNNASIFAFPSFYEGFGFPVLEAQDSGVPVVASNISSLPEILDNSALLVNPERPDNIASAIYKIIKKPELRKELINRGYKNIKRFDWKDCARKTLKLISK